MRIICIQQRITVADRRKDAPQFQQLPDTREETTMTWETPQACDLRFGFEITMYIAAR
jgi:coenzyme PQQ precursor peptide PqqA